MPFGTLTGSTGTTFEPRSPGIYSDSTKSFSDPLNEFRITGASTKRDGSRSGAITRVQQVDSEVGSTVLREQAVVNLNISLPSSGRIPASVAEAMIDDIGAQSAILLSRLLQGEA
jgi:hypothetical protein